MNFKKKPAILIGAVAIVLLCSLLLIAHFHRQRTNSEHSATTTESTAVGKTAAPSAKTLPIQVERGEGAFSRHCSRCHQIGGVGKTGVAPSVRNPDFLALTTDDFIQGTIRMGREQTAMISRSDLPREDVEDLIAYLRSVQGDEVRLVVTVDPALQATGDEKAGGTKYIAYCASCHGPDGSGYAGGYEAPGIGLPGFLNIASDDYILQTTMRGRVGTTMRPLVGHEDLGNLDIWDAYDIITFLRTRSQARPREVPAGQ